MATVTEKNYAFEFLLSEADGTRSREVVTILSAQNLKAGAILGKVTATGKYRECNQDGSAGEEVAVAVLCNDTGGALGADTKMLIIARDAEVKGDLLYYKSDADAGEKATMRTQLAAVGIIVR